MAVQSAKEAVFLPPDFVRKLVVHSNASDEIHVRERNDNDSVQALDKRETLAKTTLVDQVALASDSRCELVSLNFTFAEAVQVVDKEAARILALHRDLRLFT